MAVAACVPVKRRPGQCQTTAEERVELGLGVLGELRLSLRCVARRLSSELSMLSFGQCRMGQLHDA